MKSKGKIMTSKFSLIAAVVLLSGFAGLALQAAPEAKKETAATPQQKGFDTPQQAADSLVQAAETFDVSAIKEILGPDSEDLVSSDDPVMDKQRAMAFVAKAKAKNSIEVDPK